MFKCIAVVSGKGGVGKSTLTAGIASALASNGSRVLILDADIGLRSQDALLSLENRVVYDLVDLADGNCLPEQAVLPSEDYPSLFLLPASQFARAKNLDPKKLKKIIRSLAPDYDYCLIDCPSGLERGLRNVLNAGVDEILLVVTPDDISVRDAERTLQVIDEKGLPRPGLIVNRLVPDLVRTGDMMSSQVIASVLDISLAGEVPEDPAVRFALLKKKMLMQYDCEARNAVLRIAARLTGKTVPFPLYGHDKPSWRQRFRRRQPKEVISIDNH